MAIFLSNNVGTTIEEEYNLGKLLNLGLGVDFCKDEHADNIKMLPVYMKLSYVIGIWVQLSVIAVLTLFCTFILITSLLAEQLDEKTKEEVFLTEGDSELLSFSLKEWLSQFNQLHILVERIKDCFSPILAIVIFYLAIQFPYEAYLLVMYIMQIIHGFQPPEPLNLILLRFLKLLLRLGTIVFAVQQLQDKVESIFFQMYYKSFLYNFTCNLI